jgi:50S ribosomal protein L16 3-hydroxylase
MTSTILGQSRQAFLSNAWRRSFTLFPGAVNPAHYCVSREEIGQLVASELVESRLVGTDHAQTWGPFEDTGEGDLLPQGQLLLVHCLEQHLPRISQMLMDHFSFMPRWQIDDVMISVGKDGASCGAHFDHYDVFLVQVEGSKRWQLDRQNHNDNELRDDVDIRLLSTFRPEEELTLNPGDVLYVPPGAGHHGICEGYSVTLSVGIRNPALNEIFAELMQDALDTVSGVQPVEGNLHQSDVISDSSIQSIRRLLENAITDHAITRWYGEYVTRLREPAILDSIPVSEPQPGQVMELTLPSRAAIFDEDDRLMLFVNGHCYALAPVNHQWLADLVSVRRAVFPKDGDADAERCIQALCQSGAITSARDLNP